MNYEPPVTARLARPIEARIERMEAILRHYGLHEPGCASLPGFGVIDRDNYAPTAGYQLETTYHSKRCDCWLRDGSGL